jgi:hypothetical protein
MTELAPPPPPVGFTYDGSPDALAKIEHLVGRNRMRMVEVVEVVEQLNMRTMRREEARLPRPDPTTLEIRINSVEHPDVWVYVPLGSRIEHAWNSDVTLMVSLGPAVHPIEFGEVRQ